MDIPLGTLGRAESAVTGGNTARAMGSGSLEVFATPAMVALMEAAAVDALSPLLAPGETSVGTRLEISHDAASPVGAAVRAEAEVTGVDRRRVVFAVRAYDAQGQIGGGVHERFIVNAEKFLAKAQARGA